MGARLLLLDGQGSSPSISTSTSTGPSSPTSVPPVPPPSSSTLAALFLRQAHVSLRARFTSLSASIRSELEADSPATAAILTQLREGHLCLPTTHVTLLRHPLISLPSLYVAQVVRILEEVEVRPEMLVSGASDLEIIGYSSGLLPALLVATSLPALSPASESGSAILDPASQFQLLSNALALFDLTVVFGIHTQLARSRLHAAAGLSLDDPAREREWSVVVFGVSRQWLQGKVDAWNATKGVSSRFPPSAHRPFRSFFFSFLFFSSGICNVALFCFRYHPHTLPSRDTERNDHGYSSASGAIADETANTASSANVSRRPGITDPFPNPELTLFGHTGDRPMRDQSWHVA